MNVISLIASLMTIFLFIGYIIGRIWTIKENVQYSFEQIEVLGCVGDGYIQDYENDFVFQSDCPTIVRITSPMAYKTFSVSEIDFDNEREIVLGKKKEITRHDIPINTPLYLVIKFVDCQPLFMAEFERADGVKGSFLFEDSGRTGEVVRTNYKLEHTWKSRLYYFFK